MYFFLGGGGANNYWGIRVTSEIKKETLSFILRSDAEHAEYKLMRGDVVLFCTEITLTKCQAGYQYRGEWWRMCRTGDYYYSNNSYLKVLKFVQSLTQTPTLNWR